MSLADWKEVVGIKGTITQDDKIEGNASYVSPDSRSIIVHTQTETDKPVVVTTTGYFKVTAIDKNIGFAFKIQPDNSGLIIRIRETT